MKKDLFAKRFLVVCAGISMVMLSTAFLIRSATPAYAAIPASTPSGNTTYGSGVEIYPMGVENGTVYWLEYVDKWYFQSKPVTDWK